MQFIKHDDVVWREIGYLRQGESRGYDYRLWLNEPLASWDVWDYWEKERIASMRTHLKRGDVLYDIGTEQGWCNLAYAQMVGPENMVLIEPTPEFWPNIKALWERNCDKQPRGFYAGLLSDKTTDTQRSFSEWPDQAAGDLVDRNKYQYIHKNEDSIPELRLDDMVERSGIIPDALTMDVEGAELLILRGAEKTLKTYKPKVWVSIHPDLGLRDYGVTAQETIDFMTNLGYKKEHLATDHECHYYFSPMESN